MISKFKIFESKEIQSVLDTLKKYLSFSPKLDLDFGYSSHINTETIKDSEGKVIIKNIIKYIRWIYRFDKDDDIVIDSIFIKLLYDDLGVYNNKKEMMLIRFHTDRFAQSKHTLTKGELGKFIEFSKDPNFFIDQEKYNL